MEDPRLKKLAKLLVSYSVKIKPEDRVFIICDDVAVPWMKEITKAAILAGGHVENMLTCEEVNEIKLRYGTESQLSQGNFLMEQIANNADVLLTCWGGRNTKANAGIDAAALKFQSRGSSAWRKLFSDRIGDGSLRWCGTQFPTFSDAQEAGMSLTDYEDFVYGAGLLDADDPIAEWGKFSASQEKWLNYLNGKSEIHILSRDTDITVSVEGREWVNCDGHQNFPDGEIYTSPVEDAVNGHCTFSFPGIYNGKEVEGIRLEVRDGLITDATAKKGEELLQAILTTDAGASRFGEVAIGTNYSIKRFTRNILFDEKIGGTVHLAIGQSFPEIGGVNTSTIHWDMLCDMREEGKIFADGELFYQNGQFKDILG